MACKPDRIAPSESDFHPQSSSFIFTNDSIDLSSADNQAFSPMVCQQRQSAINNITYRDAINGWRPTSIEELVNSIEKLASGANQIDRAWIIFYWISQNIGYDTTAYLKNKIGAQKVDKVFQSKQAVSEGYSSIYADLCQRTGIKCQKINGFSKGFGFNMRHTRFSKNDTWNIITLDNAHSYFIESTWGSGHLITGTKQYKAELNPHYFMCPPEQMICEHLPENASYQLLAHPITMNQYFMLLHVHPAFFISGLQIISPVGSNRVDLVEKQSYGEVVIRTSAKDTKLSGSLKDEKGAKIEGADFLYLDKSDRTLWRCRFAPQKSGKYNIEIYVQENHDQLQSYSIAVEFIFDITRLSQPPVPFPYTWPSFFEYNLEIIKPRNTGFIDWSLHASNGYGEILIRSPNNVHISLSMKNPSTNEIEEDTTLTNFDQKANLWRCLFAPLTFNTPLDLIISTKYSNEDKSHSAVKFNLSPLTKSDVKQTADLHSIPPLTNIEQYI